MKGKRPPAAPPLVLPDRYIPPGGRSNIDPDPMGRLARARPPVSPPPPAFSSLGGGAAARFAAAFDKLKKPAAPAPPVLTPVPPTRARLRTRLRIAGFEIDIQLGGDPPKRRRRR